MSKVTKREERRAHQRREQMRNYAIWNGLGVMALAVIGFMIWRGVRPSEGESVPEMVSSRTLR